MDKAKQKTIMDMSPQELLKSFVQQVGTLIDARIKTAEITIKANTDASITAAKDELKAELASKKDLERLEQKLDKSVQDHKERLEIIEEHIGLPHKN